MAPGTAAGRAEWVPAPVPEAAAALEAAGYPVWMAACLARRGVGDAAAAELYLNPSLDQLSDPFELPNLRAAVERLSAACDAGETVALVGDYDVDGVGSAALLTAVFKVCGLEVETMLPHRLEEGYGFQPVHVERAAAAGCGLIVTADCGSSSIDAAEAALAAGIDLIVADHHLADAGLPAAVIEVNPQRHEGDAPWRQMAAAGIAFKLAQGLAERRGKPVPLEALLRIACLGTIADMVPLKAENRLIAALGLAALPDTPSIGLRSLFGHAGLRLPITASDIGFRVAPRLNAAGRLGSAEPALELLLTRDGRRARGAAAELDQTNGRRQEMQRQVEDEAREAVLALTELPPILVAWSAAWHRGVVGIAAGRLAREFHRPALLLSVDGDTASGSGRSVPGIELYRFLAPWRDRLERFGGHAQAIGMSVSVDALEALKGEWEEAAAGWDADLLVPRIVYELDLAPGELDRALLDSVRRLGPFGMGNREPLARMGPLRLSGAPRVFGKGHLSARAIDAAGATVDLLGWGWEERAEALAEPFEVLGVPTLDRFHDRPTLRLLDSRPADWV